MSIRTEAAIRELVLGSRFYGSLFLGIQLKPTDGPAYWTIQPSGECILYTKMEHPFSSPDLLNHLKELLEFFLQLLDNQIKALGSSPIIKQAILTYLAWNSAQKALFKIRTKDRLLALSKVLTEEEEDSLNQKGYSFRLLTAQVEESFINWRTVLSQFIQSGLRGETKYSFHRTSRRYGTVPGIKIRRKPKLGLALDRSGSISEGQLADFWKQINQLYLVQSDFFICEFDHRIQRISRFHPGKTYPANTAGGTNFDPPIQWANENQLQGLIILTDGFAPKPVIRPQMPCLWILSTDTQTVLPGKQILLNEKQHHAN